jgi:8-oxo-dGTP pyrophosphatase MutT (NUDIX family)
MSAHAAAVRAAGGVVVRPVSDGMGAAASAAVEVLLVHRPRYDDWTFPKGKCDPGELDTDAARREVLEETGYSCTLGRELTTISYHDHKGRPKQVRYWLMTVSTGSFVANDEVDVIEWIVPLAAADRLTYAHDRVLLTDIETERS